ncbi:hypothetical protein [Rubritalea tangerina]
MPCGFSFLNLHLLAKVRASLPSYPTQPPPFHQPYLESFASSAITISHS